jgi:ABC-type branched-subunit amino acid transport system permease subunit
MKKSRIFMAIGAFVLAITAVFATKANKKFGSVTKAYLHGSSAYVDVPSGILTTSGSSLKTAYLGIYTLGGTRMLSYTIVTSSGSTNKVRFD